MHLFLAGGPQQRVKDGLLFSAHLSGALIFILAWHRVYKGLNHLLPHSDTATHHLSYSEGRTPLSPSVRV